MQKNWASFLRTLKCRGITCRTWSSLRFARSGADDEARSGAQGMAAGRVVGLTAAGGLIALAAYALALDPPWRQTVRTADAPVAATDRPTGAAVTANANGIT